MIDWLKGIILKKNPTYALLNVNGVGYGITIPLSTYEKLGEDGADAELHIELILRENDLRLFGFYSIEEKKFFQKITNVSGIGPRTAIAMLSTFPAVDLMLIINTGNVQTLTKIPGIGKKTAQRILFELQEKFELEEGIRAKSLTHTKSSEKGRANIIEDTVLGLMALGYRQKDVENVVYKALERIGSVDSVEVLLKETLKEMK
ncbi:MAG: Holliday junction branch migration protein RuvA [Calditrichia bacterium]|nr:Holliday junction branch migration protein RuvA [Calditrichia bacterium]